MSWAIGEQDGRDIGYGVPSQCDKPGCKNVIDRGMGYACGGECGRFFCADHTTLVEHRCRHRADYTRDLNLWVVHKLRDDSWANWRAGAPWEVKLLSAIIMDGYRFKTICSCGGQMKYWTSPYLAGCNPHDEQCQQYAEFDKWANTPCLKPA